MKKVHSNLENFNNFIPNLSYFFSSNLITQACAFIVILLFARNYSAIEFGKFTVAQTVFFLLYSLSFSNIHYYLNKAISQNGLPSKVVIDGSKSNYAAIDSMNVQLWLTGYFMLSLVEILDIKYLNNIVEQSHRWVKQKTRQALGWKSTEGALASLHGREMWTMLKQGFIQ